VFQGVSYCSIFV